MYTLYTKNKLRQNCFSFSRSNLDDFDSILQVRNNNEMKPSEV